ncbi:MAG: hypothetical protein ABI655_01405, partial [Phenylobacterium sp.]
ADEPPVATAPPAAAAPISTAEQIEQYLKSSRVTDLPTDAAPGVTSGEEPRRVHGEVSVAVGTGGYRSAYVRTDLPVGRTGTLSIAVQDTRFNGRLAPRGYGGWGYGGMDLGLALALGGAGDGPACRNSWEGLRLRPDDPWRIDDAAARRCLRPQTPPDAR